jgi:hypothetical protein
MKKMILVIMTFTVLLMSSCQTPHRVDVFNLSDEIIDGVVYQDCSIDGGRINLILSINLDEDIDVNDLIAPSSYEFKNDNIGYGFGDGFGEKLLLNNDYQISINDVLLQNNESVILSRNTDYTLRVIFDISKVEGINLDAEVEDLSMIVVIGTKTANFLYD